MKQFIHIDNAYYSVDGILSVNIARRQLTDVLPDMVNQIQQIINEDLDGNSLKTKRKQIVIRQVDFSFGSFVAEVTHMASESPLVGGLPQEHVKTFEDATAFLQFFIETLATSTEPVLEVNGIVEDFGRMRRMEVSKEEHV